MFAVNAPSALRATQTVFLPSLTLAEKQFISVTTEGKPVVVSGELLFPPGQAGPFPAVVLAHGCGGVGPTVRAWAQQLAVIGVAALVLDSFGGREIRETCTGEGRINRGSRIIDVYRALEWLLNHQQVDRERIALMGFSQGGGVTLLARQRRFQRLWMPTPSDFSVYLAFYPGACNRIMLEETDVSDRPLGIFQGTADDWTPIETCRDYVYRMRNADKDVRLFEYAGAHHSFDNPNLPAARFRPEVLNSSSCSYIEREPGRFGTVHRGSGLESSSASPCSRRGATVGHDPAAYGQAKNDVQSFLRDILKLPPPSFSAGC